MKVKRQEKNKSKNRQTFDFDENPEGSTVHSNVTLTSSNEVNRSSPASNSHNNILSSGTSNRHNNIFSTTAPSNINNILSTLTHNNSPLLAASNNSIFSTPSNNNNQALFSISISPAVLSSSINPATSPSSSKNNLGSRRYSSNVWLYATKSDNGKTAKCSLCPYSCALPSHSTSTIRYHLIHQHNKHDLVIDSSSSVQQNKVQISEPFKRHLHSLSYKAIVIDQRPFNDLRKKGITALINELCPGYTPPHRNQVSSNLKLMYNEQYQLLKNELKNIDYIGLTMDFWSSRACVSYLCITAHYFNTQMEFFSKIIHFASFNERHTATNIANNLQENLSALGIYDKIIAITCDGGENLVAACNKLDSRIKRIWCCTHRLHLTVVNGLGLWNKKSVTDDSQINRSSTSNLTTTNTTSSITRTTSTMSTDLAASTDLNLLNDYDSDDSSCDGDDVYADGNHSMVTQNDTDMDNVMVVDEYTDENAAMVVNQHTDDNNTVMVKDHQISDEFTHEHTALDQEEIAEDTENIDSIEDNWSTDVESDILTTEPIDMVMLIMKKCRALATFTKKSIIIANLLRSYQAVHKINKTIITDCKSRWNSTYGLIDSIIIMKQVLMELFNSKLTLKLRRQQLNKLNSVELNSEDWKFLSVLKEVLEPFFLATKTMSGKNYPSIGLAYHLVQAIKHFCTHDESNNELIIELKKLLLAKINKYFFSDLEQLEHLQYHAYFDPAAHKSYSGTEINKCEKYIKQLIADDVYPQKNSSSNATLAMNSTVTTVTSMSTSQSQQALSQSKPVKQSTYDRFISACGEQNSTIENIKEKSTRISLNEELKQYKVLVHQFNVGTTPSASSVLQFWKIHHATFPILSHLAKVHLVATCSSVPSESAFSCSAFTARKERSRLSPENLAYSVFLKDKLDKN